MTSPDSSDPSAKATGTGSDPQSLKEPSSSVQAVSRMKLIALLSCFAVPLLIAALWLAWVRINGGDLGLSARGELIQPAVPLKPFTLAERGARNFDQEAFRGIWTLLYAPVGECTEVCEKNIYHMRQVRLSLVHRMTRVQRALVLESDQQVNPDLLAEHEGLRVLTGDKSALMDQFRDAQAGMEERQDALYLIDPMGNLMMRFPADLDPKSMLKDIKHLLKVSRIG